MEECGLAKIDHVMAFPSQLHHVEIIIGQPDSTRSLVAGTGGLGLAFLSFEGAWWYFWIWFGTSTFERMWCFRRYHPWLWKGEACSSPLINELQSISIHGGGGGWLAALLPTKLRFWTRSFQRISSSLGDRYNQYNVKLRKGISERFFVSFFSFRETWGIASLCLFLSASLNVTHKFDPLNYHQQYCQPLPIPNQPAFTTTIRVNKSHPTLRTPPHHYFTTEPLHHYFTTEPLFSERTKNEGRISRVILQKAISQQECNKFGSEKTKISKKKKNSKKS